MGVYTDNQAKRALIGSGSATSGWEDALGQIAVPGSGPTIPVWTQIASSVFSGYLFQVDDVVQVTYHLSHRYKPGGQVFLHAHWFPDGTNTAAVKWEWIWTYAKGFNQANFDFTGTTVTAQEAPPGTAYRHMTTEISASIATGSFETDGLIIARLRRVTNGGTDNTNGIFLFMADAHYETDRTGTVAKAPPFNG